MCTALTISEALDQEATTRPGRVISFPNGQQLTLAILQVLLEDIACGLLTFGIQHGDFVAIVSDNTIEWLVLTLAVIRCRSVAVPLRLARSSQEEFEFFLSFYENKLLLTGPGGNYAAAARAAAHRNVPHAVASIDFASNHAKVSFLNSPLRDDPAAAVPADVVNQPWDQAFVLHNPGTMRTGYIGSLTQKQLASCTDSLNLLRDLGSSFADPNQNLLIKALYDAVLVASAGVPCSTTATKAAPTTASLTVGANASDGDGDESDLKLKDVLSFSASAFIALSSTLLHKYGPEAVAHKASMPLLFIYGAVTSALVGQVLKVLVGRFHGLFKVAAILFFYAGASALALGVLPPGYSHAAFLLTLGAGVASIFLLLNRAVHKSLPSRSCTATGSPS
ncbi:hypothetical protein Taro_036238 [Colocasia esculenta]|uniref:AMP-dependent synthetase/ligase domain-containing protein n=1 Tax=Colocasia esculenta TaxID=4460 RepID=A0A843VWV5_COLES|nr:hypothetical protein [Colocasia esculenta]